MKAAKWSLRIAIPLLLLGVAAFATDAAQAAAPSVRFTVFRSDLAPNIYFRFEPASSAAGCQMGILSATSRNNLRGSRRRAAQITEFAASPSFSQLRAENVPSFSKRTRRGSNSKTIYFQARLRCGAEQSFSNIESLSFPRLFRSGEPSTASWYFALAQAIAAGRVEVRKVFQNLRFNKPLDLQNAGDERLFVAELGGKIFVFPNDDNTSAASTFLDISTEIQQEGEQGLLGFAFHPQFQQNGFVFVHYSARTTGDTTISRFHVRGGDRNQLDPASKSLVLTFPATEFQNHKGGQIAFGPDGYLYIALGDGGSSGDPLGSGQDRTTLRGKILRIDVNTPPYIIPPDNPFAGNASGFREEIFAYGFRNPFRMSFDLARGTLWVADVGQDTIEEIDNVFSGRNYGWNVMEGSSCFPPGTSCNPSGLEPPVFEYNHTVGQTVIDGHVYAGAQVPLLANRYIYADFVQGTVSALGTVGSTPYQSTELFDTPFLISSFGVDTQNEEYFVAYDTGEVFKLLPR